MRYRTFGRLGWQVSELGFGAWAIGGGWGRVDDREAMASLNEALDSGVNFIDTAQGYGNGHSEELIGKVLAERGAGAQRIYVATKIPPAGKLWWVDPGYDDISAFYPPDYLRQRVELSLRRLRIDTLDLVQFHTWTSGFNKDDQWYETMERLREEGKLLGFGISASEKRPEDVVDSVRAGRIDSVQVIYNLFEQRTAESVLEPCMENNVAAIVRVPLDEGSLTGKFTENTRFPKGDFRQHFFRGGNLKATVKRVAEIHRFQQERYPQLTLAGLALLFCLSHRAASTVIVGVRNRDQLRANLKVTSCDLLDQDSRQELKRFAWTREFWTEEVGEEEG